MFSIRSFLQKAVAKNRAGSETPVSETVRGETLSKKSNAANVTENSVDASVREAAARFKKDQHYQRKTLEDKKALKEYKQKHMDEQGRVKNELNGRKLETSQSVAKEKYGDDYTRHTADVDHNYSLKEAHRDHKDDAWITQDELKDTLNQDYNYTIMDARTNRSKGARSNSEFVDSSRKGETKTKLTKKKEQELLEKERRSKEKVNSELNYAAARNIVSTAGSAGLKAAGSASSSTAVISGYYNICDLVQGKKTVKEALKDCSVDVLQAGAAAGVSSAALTVISHTMGSSSGSIMKSMARNNVPAKIVTSVIATKDVLTAYFKGDIGEAECVRQLGERGVTIYASGWGAAVGAALVPVCPFIGATIGGLIGSAISSSVYDSISKKLLQPYLEHKERLRLIKECNANAERFKRYDLELRGLFAQNYQGYCEIVLPAQSLIERGFLTGDAEAISEGCCAINEAFGGKNDVRSFDDYKRRMIENEVDVI